MVEIKLTSEQAEWLRIHLRGIVEDGKWDSGPLAEGGDPAEHAESIRAKLDKATEFNDWGRVS